MRRYFVFCIGGKKFAIPMLEIEEVVLPQEISIVPEQDKYLKGVINLRGEIVTVVDIKIKLGLGDSEIVDKKTCFVVFKVDGHKVAVIVDEVEDVVQIQETEIKDVRDLKKTKFVEGLYRTNNDQLLLIANSRKLLEIDVIEKLKNAA
ncbi:MAG: hypothetical protein COW00_14800 [Bdellovibrio sp. CG12_big_fil_rev_8_21_14_0_65_39_13]|nr:MAG: hypothetical protein COW78_13950 [Bdellovibrio sp. CG22_combo_CG10-13_8_21_14_all_39_27]PIQ58563.1 MAG: hypothetical protein COW00_14800 [Bdellovibrio sp. CG12_big_fil_rev_8_21_14_0_65_39_13]PIR32454.1 MAG: hypothetical protein COV37_19805 [Bdellovibrio sp. CG11_big_fil_rev_8_21_14_0_20_39_38]